MLSVLSMHKGLVGNCDFNLLNTAVRNMAVRPEWVLLSHNDCQMGTQAEIMIVQTEMMEGIRMLLFQL